ncbi:hypothetical protein WM26_18515 [Burkholderia cepacia]|nr:hypothetical protein WM26_18515 [Burkholderia cepacia]
MRTVHQDFQAHARYTPEVLESCRDEPITKAIIKIGVQDTLARSDTNSPLSAVDIAFARRNQIEREDGKGGVNLLRKYVIQRSSMHRTAHRANAILIVLA